MIRRLLGLITLYPKEIFIFAVLRSFVFKYHISVRFVVLLRQPVAGSVGGEEAAGPHSLRRQSVQLVGADGDGLVQGLHGGSAGGAGVEAGGGDGLDHLLLPVDALPVPLCGPAPPDLHVINQYESYKLGWNCPHG